MEYESIEVRKKDFLQGMDEETKLIRAKRIESQIPEFKNLEMFQEMLWSIAPTDKGEYEYTIITRLPGGFTRKVDKYGSDNQASFLSSTEVFINDNSFFYWPDDFFNSESPDYLYKTKR